MNHSSEDHLSEKADSVFKSIVMPVIEGLIREYDGEGGYSVKLVPDGPLITGIEKYISVMVSHPSGIEMIVCVYWVSGSERLVLENIRLVTLSKTVGLFSVTKEELYTQIKYLSGLEPRNAN